MFYAPDSGMPHCTPVLTIQTVTSCGNPLTVGISDDPKSRSYGRLWWSCTHEGCSTGKMILYADDKRLLVLQEEVPQPIPGKDFNRSQR